MKFEKHHLYAGHQSAVYTLVALGADEFLSAGSDRIVATWKLGEPDNGNMLVRATDVVYAMCVLPGNRLLIGQAKGEVHVVDLQQRAEVKLLKVHEAPVFKIAFDETYQRIYMLGGDGSFTVHDSNDYSVLARIKVSSGKLRSVAFHPTSNLAAIGCGEGDVHFFDRATLTSLERIQLHQKGFSVNALTFSPNGDYLLTGSRDAHLNVLDVKAQARVESIPAHNYAIYDIQYNPSGNTIATSSRDKTVKIWSTDLQVLQRLDKEAGGHVNSVNHLLWLSDTELISCGDDRAVVGWTSV